MPKPFTVTDFGTVVPNCTPARAAANHARFVDVKTYATGTMPVVKAGQVYDDLDPRCKGRRVQVLKVGGDGKVMVRTISPRTCPPRTPSTTQKDTLGTVSWIALRRFRENARGFRLVRNSPLRATQSYLIGSRLAAACDKALTDMDVRVGDALVGLLGIRLAHDYLDVLTDDADAAPDLYVGGGPSDLLHDALLFASETDADTAWVQRELASKGATRTVAAHA